MYFDSRLAACARVTGVVITADPMTERIRRRPSPLLRFALGGLARVRYARCMTDNRLNDGELAILKRAREDALRVTRDLTLSPGMTAALESARLVASSPLLDAARAANLQLVTESSRITEMLASFSKVPDLWSERLSEVTSLGAMAEATRLALAEQFSATSLKSSIGEISLAGVDWSRLTEQFHIPEYMTFTLPERYLDMTTSYRSLLDSIASPTLGALAFPPVVSQYPPTEFYTGARLIEVITVDEGTIEVEEEKHDVSEELARETAAELPVALARLDVSFVNMWHGAIGALRSSNPDRVRHFAASGRELFTHVLHRLAPDAGVRAWTGEPEHFHNGSPTREARLLYVCRGINHKPFSKFVDKDIATMLEMFELYHRGTHAPDARFTDTQLSVLQLRLECALRFLLEIAEA